MTSLKPFTCKDLLKFNLVNIDPSNENYDMGFYLDYLARHPEFFQKVENVDGLCVAYIMGKVEGSGENRYGHVTTLNVTPTYRQEGMTAKLLKYHEDISEDKKAFYVNLFLSASNTKAISMLKYIGYFEYRTFPDADGDDDPENTDNDACEMRRTLSRDVEKKSAAPYIKPCQCGLKK